MWEGPGALRAPNGEVILLSLPTWSPLAAVTTTWFSSTELKTRGAKHLIPPLFSTHARWVLGTRSASDSHRRGTAPPLIPLSCKPLLREGWALSVIDPNL